MKHILLVYESAGWRVLPAEEKRRGARACGFTREVCRGLSDDDLREPLGA